MLPDQFSLYRLEEMLEDYLNNAPENTALEGFWEIWSAVKDHILLPNGYHSFEQFEKEFDFFYMGALFFDTKQDMVQECRELQKQDPECWDRLMLLYRDMLDLLTDMDEESKWNLRRAYAEAHFYKGDTTTADAFFNQLVEENPEWVWGYVGWGDLYNPNFNYTPESDMDEALRLYRMGLEKSLSHNNVLEDRI